MFTNKKSETVINGVTEVVNKSTCKLNKLWIDQGKQFWKTYAKMVRQ